MKDFEVLSALGEVQFGNVEGICASIKLETLARFDLNSSVYL